MELYALDRDLVPIGIVTEYESLVWTSNAWEHSRASMKCPLDSVAKDAVFLSRTDTSEAMIVTRRHAVSDGNEDYLEIGAYGATLLLERRVNWWTVSYTDANLAGVISVLLANAVRTYQGIDRSIAGLLALADMTATTHLVTGQASWGTISAAIFALVREAGFSFGMRYSAGGLEPFVRRGVDWTSAVVLMSECADLPKADLDIDDEAYANLAVIGGQGEGSERAVRTVRITDGLELSETWVDARDLQQDVSIGLGSISVNTSTNVITCAGHGLINGNLIGFDNDGGALPAPLDAEPTPPADKIDYYAVNCTANTFKVSLNAAGTALVDLTSAGTGTTSVTLKRYTDAQYAAMLDQRGNQAIVDAPVTRSLEATASQDRYLYRQDYSLGDRVAYRALGFAGTDIISSVTETFEKGDVRIDIGLGKSAPTLRQLIGI